MCIRDSAFDVHEYDPDQPLRIGALDLRFQPVPHFVDTWAIEFAAGGRRFVFGADCRPNDEIVEFARDADLLMLESTLPRPERTGMRGHLTPLSLIHISEPTRRTPISYA